MPATSASSRTGILPAIVATFVFWATMIGTTVPTPLYPLYRAELGFSSLMVTILFAVYAIGVVVGLLFFGRLSDQIGRVPVMRISLGLAVVAAIVFLVADSVPALIVGRVISGFGASLVTAAATAAIVEVLPVSLRPQASTFALVGNMGGLAGGTFIGGIVGEWVPTPLRSSWWVILVIALLGVLATTLIPETVATRSSVRLVVPRLVVPAAIRTVFVQTVLVGGSGFAVLGVLSSVNGIFLGSVMHVTNLFSAGLVVALAFLSVAIGQIIARGIPGPRALPIASVGMIVAAGAIALALHQELVPPLFAGGIIAGLSTGIALSGGLAAIASGAAVTQRAQVIASFFAVLYTMLALPAIGVGILIQLAGLLEAGIIFSGIVAVLAFLALINILMSGRAAVSPQIGE